MKNMKIIAAVLVLVLAAGLVGCSAKTTASTKHEYSIGSSVTTENTTPNDETSEDVTTTEEETTTATPVTPWNLLTNAKLKPQSSGNTELDNLINALIGKVVTSDMNNYYKVWNLYLYLVDNITYSRGMDANAGAYSASDKASTPKQILWATDLLNSGMGCCYNYSAAFAYIMRNLGFDVTLVTGQVPKYGGGTTPHCWVYVTFDGVKYIFDPDLEMNYYTRDMKDHKEGDPEITKDRFFCIPFETMSYFYTDEQYY